MVQFACNGPQLREKSSSATLSHTWENPDRNESINIEEDDLPFGWSESQFRQKSLSAILSLIWKNPDRNRMVNIEEADLPIALGSWKSVLRIFESPGILWLDSICINQADEDERGRQLSPMKEIYHEAKKTAQWLSCLQDLDQQGGQLEHPVSDHINIEMPGRTDTRQQGRPKTAMDASKSQGNGDYDQGQAFPCFRKMLKVLKRLSDDLHAGSLLSTPIPDHKFNFSGLGGVQYMMQKAWNTGSDWPFNGNSEDLKLEGFPKSGEQEKLLRLQGLRNSHNSWPAKCQTTRPFAPKSANERWKQSSCIMLEKERIPNTDRLYTLDHQLRSRHINLIAFSGTIGTGIFLSSPINGPLSPLMALTLIGLTVLPLMYGLGELAAEFPIGIENSRIKDLNLDQKLPISMTLLATAYSFALLTSSVSEVGSLTDELYTCLSVMAWLAIYPILYWAILKGISWSISRIRLGIQTFTESCTWSPHGRSSRSRSHIGQGLILSLLLCTTPVTAITPSLSTSTPSPCSSFLLAVCVESEKLFSVSPFSFFLIFKLALRPYAS